MDGFKDSTQTRHARKVSDMDGFKNSTKTQYSMGGEAYAKGGAVKGAAKVAKVMGEFKSGKLHSGSKSGPAVTNPKQAVAISLSEARKAGAKVPVKKAYGGAITDPAGAVARGNRMQAEEAGEDKVIVRRKSGMTPKEDTSKYKNYSDPEPAGKASALSIRLSKRGPAGARHDDTPFLDRVVGAVRDTLGFKKGGAVKKRYDEGGIVVTGPRSSGPKPEEFDLSKYRATGDDKGFAPGRNSKGKSGISLGGISPARMPSAVQPAGSSAPGPSPRGGLGVTISGRFKKGGLAAMPKSKC